MAACRLRRNAGDGGKLTGGQRLAAEQRGQNVRPRDIADKGCDRSKRVCGNHVCHAANLAPRAHAVSAHRFGRDRSNRRRERPTIFRQPIGYPMTDTVSARSGTRFVAIRGAATRLIRTVFVRWPQRRRQRMALLALSDDHLKDIGVTPAEARGEAGRPFWD